MSSLEERDVVEIPDDRRMAPWRRWGEEAVDQLLGSDPGLNRLRLATKTVAAISLALGLVAAFVTVTGALQAATPPTASASARAAIATGNRELLVIAMLIGGMVALLTTISIPEPSATRFAAAVGVTTLVMGASLGFGLGLGAHRVLVLISFPVFLAVGTLARRWGPRGAALAMPVFLGDFIGFLLHPDVKTGDLGWLLAFGAIGGLAAIVVHEVLFRADARRALRRAQRSFHARGSALAGQALTILTSPGQADREARTRHIRRLRRLLVRLNESALMIDAYLAEATSGAGATRLHERLFDAELGLTNTARFTVALAGSGLLPTDREDMAIALGALAAERFSDATVAADRIAAHVREQAETELGGAQPGLEGPARLRRILLHRFASSVALAAEAMGPSVAAWENPTGAPTTDSIGFEPAVTLNGGWLPGASQVSLAASSRPGRGLFGRVALPLWVRAAIQVAVAVALAIGFGDLLSGRRFYWAVLAAFLAFIGTNHSFEQVSKALQRVTGTVVGIVLGAVVVSVTGANVEAAFLAVLVALFFGIYLIRVSYAFMVVGVTIMVSQLYEQLGELTDSLLVLRLEETAIGAAVAVLVVLLVVPLSTRRVVEEAAVELVDAAAGLVSLAVHDMARRPADRTRPSDEARPADPTGNAGRVDAARVDLTNAARRVDSAHQSLVATARPLRRLGSTGRWAQRILTGATGLRHHSRNLVWDAPHGPHLEERERILLAEAASALTSSFAAVGAALRSGRGGEYVRSAARWASLEESALDCLRAGVITTPARHLPPTAGMVLTARDLQLVDGALAEIGWAAGMTLTSLDAPVGSFAARSARV